MAFNCPGQIGLGMLLFPRVQVFSFLGLSSPRPRPRPGDAGWSVGHVWPLGSRAALLYVFHTARSLFHLGLGAEILFLSPPPCPPSLPPPPPSKQLVIFRGGWHLNSVILVVKSMQRRAPRTASCRTSPFLVLKVFVLLLP